MKIVSKQILNKKQNVRALNVASPIVKHKGLSKSVSKSVKALEVESPVKKVKESNLKVIKEVTKKKKEKKEDKKEQKKKKVNYCLNLKQLKPVNLEREKDIFFDKGFQYNPFFIYPNISDLNDDEYKDAKRYDTADQTLIALALMILQKSLQADIINKLKESPILQRPEVQASFDKYIKNLDASNLLSYQFVQNTIAPTSVIHNNNDGMSRVMISLPIKYRQNTMEGVLNHEIGTHFVRKHNDRLQKWHKDRKKFGLSPYLMTEQGLAAINQLISYITNKSMPPLLYRAALLYYCSYLASKYSFAQIFKAVAKYQPDPQTRWRECVRVKRGIADTSKPNGMYKDQIYFMGAVEILKNRKKLNMYHLHSGKITVEDCLRLSEKKQINEEKLKYPYFLQNMKEYNHWLDMIAETNMIKE